MLKRNKKLMVTIAAAAGVFLGITINSIIPSSVSAASSRLWGQDRYETAVEVSKQGWQNSDYVVLASGEGYADALCAAPLAKKYNAPILLTDSKGLNEKTKEEIKRLNAKNVLIIGKYASVSKAAEEKLSSIVTNVQRFGGNDRYETSVIVAKELGTIDKVVVTSGNGFADALSIASIAAQENMPILLTDKNSLPTVVNDYIAERKSSITNAYIIGGAGSISDVVAKEVSQSFVRLGGSDRFETNLKVMEYFKDKIKFDNLYVVQADGPTGMEFADALSGSALAVKTSAPVILTYKTIPQEVENFIKEKVSDKSSIIALGGIAAVPETLVEKLESLKSQLPPEVPENPEPAPVPAPSGGGGGGGSTGGDTPSTVIDEKTREELTSMLNKMDFVINSLGTEKEKEIVIKVQESINKTLDDPNYNFKSDANQVKGLYKSLTDEEQRDFIKQVTERMTVKDLLQLKEKFGL